MANGRYPGRVGAVADSGTHPGRTGGGEGEGRQDGPQADLVSGAGRPCPQAGGQGERPADVAKVLGVSRRTMYRCWGQKIKVI